MTTKKSKRWKPVLREKFWAFDEAGLIFDSENYFKNDFTYFVFGVYRTKKDAETALRKIKKFVKEEL